MSASSVKTGEVGTSLLVGNTADVSDYESIATVEVGAGGTPSVTFSSIATTWTHLQLRMILRMDAASTQQNYFLRMNGDTATNYDWHRVYGSGASVHSDADAPQSYILLDRTAGSTASANIFGATVVDILDYKNTNKYKTTRMIGGIDLNGASTSYMMFSSGLWRSTSAITSLTIYPSSGNWVQYSHFALYGIKGAA